MHKQAIARSILGAIKNSYSGSHLSGVHVKLDSISDRVLALYLIYLRNAIYNLYSDIVLYDGQSLLILR
jgi:hypothetical protein